MASTHSFIAYVDESGDDGIRKFRSIGTGGASHWLTIAAIVVRKENDYLMPSWRDEISRYFVNKKSRDIHFANLSHEQRVLACGIMSSKPHRICAVMSNKTTIISYPRRNLFSEKNTLYWYLCRYLIERLSYFCRDMKSGDHSGDGRLKIVFSRRGGMNYDDFKSYLIKLKRSQQNIARIHKNIFWPSIDIDAIEAVDHKNRAGLQLADIAASSFSAAVEPNRYGGFEDRYASILSGHVMSDKAGQKLNFGIKPVPRLDQMNLAPDQERFFNNFSQKKCRPPAPASSRVPATAILR